MNNLWTNYFAGYVKIKVTGKLIEPFLNECVRENVIIWNLKRIETNSITGYVLLNDVQKIRRIIRKSDCKLEFIGRKGMPFLLKKITTNSGVVIGIMLAFFSILLLSNMVWDIEITGANPKIEHDIRKELSKMGIKQGKLLFLLPENDEIQNKLTEELQSVTWVGVKLNGTTYHLEVVEKKLAEKQELLSPRHLVAKKKAVIYDYFVEQGQPIIKINDFVRPGQIIVSGIIGKENNTEIVAAKGKIFGEIWYKSTISVPLHTVFNVYTGEQKKKHYIEVFGITIPVWGFEKVDYKKLVNENYEKHIRFLKWDLPISYKNKIIREQYEYIRYYDKETAVAVAKNTARTELKAKLDDDAVIKGEKVLHQVEENGKVKLTIHYQVIEDIAEPQPIIQGD